MAAPVTPPAELLADLHARIREALAEVKGAEAAKEHCPSTENEEMAELTWYRLDRLLDLLPREEMAG